MRAHIPGNSTRMPKWLAASLLLAMTALWVSGAVAAERRTVWERQDQFVAVEKQDVLGAPNDHPAQLPAEVLRSALGSLLVTLKEGQQPVPLFTEGGLDVLVDAGQKGLSLAGPGEDVTFAVVGLHPALLGLFKQPMVTTGRLFIRQGNLNLILGMVHEPVNDRDDRRLKPFIPGSRSKGKSPAWRLTTQSGEKVQAGADRPDWVVLSLAAAVPDVQQQHVDPATKPGSAAPIPKSAPPANRTMEERLLLLNDLWNKKLITEEEYRAKRQKILDGI